MSRRKTDSGVMLVKGIGYLLYLYALLCIFLIKLIINILVFFIRMIRFYRTKYKVKSGNGFFKTYFDKGYWGEYQLYRRLIKVFGEDNLLTNIYLPSKNIDNTEIDVLGVHNGIVYCYEMKNYSGHIYGRQTDKNWTQVLRFRTKNKFYNPIRQNYAHTKALGEYLEIEEHDIVPIIVFSNRANLANVNVTNVNIKRLNDSFATYDGLQGKLTNEEIINKLISNTNVEEQVKDEHIEQVNLLKQD